MLDPCGEPLLEHTMTDIGYAVAAPTGNFSCCRWCDMFIIPEGWASPAYKVAARSPLGYLSAEGTGLCLRRMRLGRKRNGDVLVLPHKLQSKDD